jgi:hypothetical protein
LTYRTADQPNEAKERKAIDEPRPRRDSPSEEETPTMNTVAAGATLEDRR